MTRTCLLVTAVLSLAPFDAFSDTLTLRFKGTADLTGFGGSPASVFAGSVTWDPDAGWIPMWPGCPDFCLDGSPGAVSATFALDSVDYTDRIDPISRFIVWGFGGVSLDLYFTPAIDVDAGLAPELRLASLNLFSDPADPTLLVDGELPHDLRFLPSVNDRYLVFSNACVDESCEEVHVNAHTLSVVAEPSSGALLVVGLLAGAAVRRYRPRAPASLSSAARPRRGSSGGPVRPRPTSALG